MLPVPPPYPLRRLLLVAVLGLGGCFQSTLPGDMPPPGPPLLTGGTTFELFGVEGRCTIDAWHLEVEEGGAAQVTYEQNGLTFRSNGFARGEMGRVVVSLTGLATLEFLRTDDEWSGHELWHVFSSDELVAWAVTLSPRVEPLADLPSFRACAAFEQWSLHELEGGASHMESVIDIEQASWRGQQSEFPLWLDVDSDGRVLVQNNRLRLHDSPTDSGGGVDGEVVSWDGVEGIVRVRNSLGLCSVADGEFVFRLVGDEIHVMQSWYVVDTIDQDNDGDREERHLRRTRSVLTQGACPSTLRR